MILKFIVVEWFINEKSTQSKKFSNRVDEKIGRICLTPIRTIWIQLFFRWDCRYLVELVYSSSVTASNQTGTPF
jgi:hypothetical protein